MIPQPANAFVTPAPRTASWGAVFALTLCVSTLIASEFMPVSLLTPLATDLHVSEGRAGQAVSVSGLFAVLTSLVIASIARAVDRRQLAITAGASLGGLLFDRSGYQSTFVASAGLLGGAALLALWASRAPRTEHTGAIEAPCP